jgi:hypothetical protein
MKLLMTIALFSLSISAFATCKEEAINIAEEAVRLFNVNDQSMHCMAIGGLEKIESLPVIMVMPRRYSYEATFFFPCGPQPKNPKVNMMLNEECKIVDLAVKGFEI